MQKKNEINKYPSDVEEYLKFVKKVMDEAYEKLKNWKPKRRNEK